jgi:hypothetical protein
VLEKIRRGDRAGGYAERRYKELRKQWQLRVFRRWPLYVAVAATILVVVATLLSDPFKTVGMVLAASVIIAWWTIRESLAPDHIARWQRGAWGEQNTAKALKPLRKDGWVIRHDLQTRHANRDHVVAGPSLYLLETKNFYDSELTLEGDVLRVRRIDQPTDTYVMDELTAQMERRARQMWREQRAATGTSVYVHPVVVLWGRFPQQEAYSRGVAYVAGDGIAEWLSKQPAELDDARRERAAAWLRNLR